MSDLIVSCRISGREWVSSLQHLDTWVSGHPWSPLLALSSQYSSVYNKNNHFNPPQHSATARADTHSFSSHNSMIGEKDWGKKKWWWSSLRDRLRNNIQTMWTHSQHNKNELMKFVSFYFSFSFEGKCFYLILNLMPNCYICLQSSSFIFWIVPGANTNCLNTSSDNYDDAVAGLNYSHGPNQSEWWTKDFTNQSWKQFLLLFIKCWITTMNSCWSTMDSWVFTCKCHVSTLFLSVHMCLSKLSYISFTWPPFSTETFVINRSLPELWSIDVGI